MASAFTHLRPDAIIKNSVVWNKLKDYNDTNHTLNVPGTILPYTSETYDIGTTDVKWRNLYAKNIYSSFLQSNDITCKNITGEKFDGGTSGEFIGGIFTGITFTGDTFNGYLAGTASNAELLNNRNYTSSNNVFGSLVWVNETGDTNVGKYLDLHFDNESDVDYSTRLEVTGNNNNIITLPAKNGAMALLSDVTDAETNLNEKITTLSERVEAVNDSIPTGKLTINEKGSDVIFDLHESKSVTIPNGTLTVKKNGSLAGTFNLYEDSEINITVEGQDGNTTYELKQDGNTITLVDMYGANCGSFILPEQQEVEGDGNTTYTFTSGTNGFTVTPSDGVAQTVAVTPYIDNVTGSKSGLMTPELLTKVTNNETNISNLTSTVAGLSDTVNSHTSSISSINSSVSNLSSIISGSSTGYKEVTSIVGVPVGFKYVYATISANASFSMASTMTKGKDVHIIIENTSSTDITISLPTSSPYVNMTDDTLTVPANGFAEINVVSRGDLMFIRSA